MTVIFCCPRTFLESLKHLPKIEEKRINILRKIGNGAFAEVYSGTIQHKGNLVTQIAIKVINSDFSKCKLLRIGNLSNPSKKKFNFKNRN